MQARIASIESRFGVRSAPLAPTAGAGASVASFESMLESQLGLSGQSGLSGAGATVRTGGVDVPGSLAAFGNGRIPEAALVPIGVGDHRLAAPAAASFQRLREAAAADGVTIGVTDSYRDLHSQERLAEEKGLYSQGGLAATPGTSNHGWGMALDLDLDDRAQAWMRANGARFGFVADVPREPWHWTFHGTA